MKMERHVFFLVICSVLIASCSSSSTIKDQNGIVFGSRSNRTENINKPTVILISIDGYRYDYTDLYSPPHLKRFRDQGVAADYLLPVFPSKTFTNHYSIATGLYADHHGIVANQFYDPKRNQSYRLSDRKTVEDGSWYNGTPLWVAAEKQGMVSATYFWPASEASIQETRPSYYVKYDDKIPLETRIAEVKRWLELSPDQRPHFITLYFSNVDSAGHKFGPGSNEVREAVLKVDQAIGALVQICESKTELINLVILSDHGMQKLDPEKVIYLNHYTNLDGVKTEGTGPQVLFYFEDLAKREKVYRDLKRGKHFKVYKRENMPKSFHFGDTARAGDLIAVAEAPYSLAPQQVNFKLEAGGHGYDPDRTETMRGIFYASGPQFKKKTRLSAFRNIHIYPMILNLLGLKTLSPIDGKADVLAGILNTEGKETVSHE